MKEFEKVVITKNRGWRGLTEISIRNSKDEEVTKLICSLSQDVWEDLMDGHIAIQDDTHYYVLNIDNIDALPQGHQRSVLIKNFKANITEVNSYEKSDWDRADGIDWAVLRHFRYNKNNHTTSEWNYIGLRVIPEI